MNKPQNIEGGVTNENKGIFIVIEGTDGSGKGTQCEILIDKLKQAGHKVATFDFPQYESHSSYFVKEYLNGSYGTAEEVGPYTASIFYALDRYEAAPKIKKALEEGCIVVANRFTGSNMAHQGTKFSSSEERNGYFLWLEAIEFKMLGIPRPDISLVLRVPAQIAQKLVDKKGARSYTDKQRDIHEADLSHLEKSVQVYDDLCRLFPKDFKQLDCARNDKILSIDAISKLIWETVHPLLPQVQEKNMSKTKPEENKFLDKNSKGTFITEQGKNELKKYISNTEGDVYAFNANINPVTVAAAMARLSRRGDDMRITLLDEFIEKEGKDGDLLKRVITAYGDDSVQQLVGQHVVIEGASQLLTKKLEWGRLASYLEQSTRYIFFDKKDKNGRYRYFIPEYLESSLKEKYINTMDKIFDNYSRIVNELTNYIQQNSKVSPSEQDAAWRSATRAQACDAARPVLPVATTSTVGIYASGQALESLIMHLMSDQLPEADSAARKLLIEARSVLSVFLERVDLSDRGAAWMGYRAETYQNVKQFASENLTQNYSSNNEAVNLVDYWPKSEVSIAADILYDHTHLSMAEIKQQIEKLDFNKKTAIIKEYIGDRYNRRHKPGRAFEKIHYSFDLLCDYGSFRDLQRHRIVDDMNWQLLTPRYGYDVPDLVEKAGLSDLYENCFDLSLGLFSELQKANYEQESQYATLLGHKMRWKVTINARAAFHFIELRTSPQGHPGYRKIAHEMYQKIASVHPIIAEGMKFVNQDEDPELSRLAAERYTQYKLNQVK